MRVVAGALLVLALALAWPAVRHLRERPPAPPPSVRLALAAPPGAEIGSGDEALDAAIAPDGRSIVFVATADGTARLWRRTIDSERVEPLAGTDGAQLPAWKRTANVVAFFSDRKLRQVSLNDSAVRDLADASSPAGCSWLPDGSLLFAPESRGPIRLLKGGAVANATTMKAGDRAHAFPIAAGASGAFVYTAVRDDGTRVARLVDANSERELVTTSGHAQLVGDLLLYVRDGALLAQRYDAGTGALGGPYATIATNVGVSASGRGLFTASDRLLLSSAFAPRARTLTWLSLDGGLPAIAGEPGDYWQARISPDDRFVAITITAPLLHTLDIVVVPSDGKGDTEALTRALAADSDPVWSPDGTRIAFRSLQSGQPNLFTHAVHRADAKDEPMMPSPLDETPTDWRNGRILFQAPDARNGADLWSVASNGSELEPMVKGSFNETDGRWSPDGRWLAYVSDESGQPDIYAVRTADGTRARVSFGSGMRPRWRRDGGALFFLRGSRIMRSDLEAEGTRFAAASEVANVPGVRDFDVAHRRNAIAALVPAQATASTTVNAIVDWKSLISTP